MKDIIENFKDKFECGSDERLAQFLGTQRNMLTVAKATTPESTKLGRTITNAWLLMNALLNRVPFSQLPGVMHDFEKVKQSKSTS